MSGTQQSEALLGNKNKVEFTSTLGSWSVTIILLFILLSTTAFWGIEKEELNWQDSLYVIVLTITTVGYGDIVPVTDGGKVFIIFFIFFGLSIVAACFGLVVGQIAATVNTCLGQDRQQISSRTCKHRLLELLIPTVLVALNMVGFAVFLHFNEDADWVTAFYWAMVSLSSVGYGDPLIKKEDSRICLTIFLLYGVTATAWCLAKIVGVVKEMEEDRQLNSLVQIGVTKELIQELDEDSSGEVNRCEFLGQMLVKMNRVRANDVHEILKLFDTFDRDRSGTISKADITAPHAPSDKNA
jgi:potassium channel subfamily K